MKIADGGVGPVQLGASLGSTVTKTANYTIVATDRVKFYVLVGLRLEHLHFRILREMLVLVGMFGLLTIVQLC